MDTVVAHPGGMELSGVLYLVHANLCLALLQLQLLMQPGHPLQELHYSTAAFLAPRAPEIRHQLLECLVVAPDHIPEDRNFIRLRAAIAVSVSGQVIVIGTFAAMSIYFCRATLLLFPLMSGRFHNTCAKFKYPLPCWIPVKISNC